MTTNSLRKQFNKANQEAIRACLAGFGPDDTVASETAGARVAFNIPAVHVPAFVTASLKKEPPAYKNTYDLVKERVGDFPNEVSRKREIVDRALPLPNGGSPESTYFGAVELNGAGVRFYGDFCLLLQTIPPDTVILDRNSYDLIRSPIRERVDEAERAGELAADARKREAKKLAGTWSKDLTRMAIDKVLGVAPMHVRRLTAGTISGGVLTDEDYIEVLKQGSFTADDLQTVRTHSHDAGCDALIANRMRTGPFPSLAAFIWQARRRTAEQSLRQAGLSVQVVTTAGRVKS